MLVKGTYTSVWDDEIFLTSDIEADTEKHTFELAEMPKDTPWARRLHEGICYAPLELKNHEGRFGR